MIKMAIDEEKIMFDKVYLSDILKKIENEMRRKRRINEKIVNFFPNILNLRRH